jgi:hypothetical protein
MNWAFISQKTAFFIVTAVETSNLTCYTGCLEEGTRKKNGAYTGRRLKPGVKPRTPP